METAQPGHYWKTPFIWEPGCQAPPAAPRLAFEAAPADWLLDAVAQVMSNSNDESDRVAVAELGADGAASELLALAPQHFELRPLWWRRARDEDGRSVGFVLPVLLRGDKTCKDGRPQGTIFYMGVLPGLRGRGHGGELLAQATRTFVAAGCWRIFCDTGSDNHPMVSAFRRAGYIERTAWQRPVR